MPLSLNTSLPTTKWATMIFRVVLYVAGLGNIAIISFTHMSADLKLNIVEASSFATLAVHLASKSFRIELPDEEEKEDNSNLPYTPPTNKN